MHLLTQYSREQTSLIIHRNEYKLSERKQLLKRVEVVLSSKTEAKLSVLGLTKEQKTTEA